MGYVPRGRLDAVHMGGLPAPSDVESLDSAPHGSALASLFLAMAERRLPPAQVAAILLFLLREEHLAGS